MRSTSRSAWSGISISCRNTFPLSSDARPSTVSFTAQGCSKISLSMKCLYPAFSAMTGSHDTLRALLGHAAAGVVGELDARRRDDRHLLVAEKHDVARVAQDRRDVGGDEELPVAQTDDDRRAVAHGDDLVRVVGRDQHQREQAAHVQQRPPHRVLESVVFHLALDEVRDDLRVGLGDERVPFLLQLLLQIEVVLDDAVVHDDDAAGAVAVRDARSPRSGGRASPSACGRCRTRRRSACVAMTSSSRASLPALRRRSIVAVANHRNAGRVVAAIFEPAQAVDEDRHDLLASRCSR